MARCPFAIWRPIPENSTQARITPTQAIAHSAVDAPGPTSLYGFFARADVVLESHFFIKLDGVIEQYLDTDVRADANYLANIRAVSFETEDEGNPDQREWTPAQVASIKRLLAWLFIVHPGILPRMCPAWNEPGVGYHSMWGAPSNWTPVPGKTCPGVIRKLQWAREIEPWIRAVAQHGVPNPAPVPPPTQEDDMVTIIHAPERPPRAIIGSKLIGFKSGQYTAFRAAVAKAGVPIIDWTCSVEQYDQVSETFIYSHAKVVN